MRKDDPKIIKFVKKVFNDCIDHGVIFNMINGPTVDLDDDGSTCSGTFLDGESLDVAIGCPTDHWFPVLVHEYNHFIQWQKKTPAWKRCNQFAKKYPKYNEDAVTVFWRWVAKERSYTKKIVYEAMQITRDLELECEQMSVEMLKKMKIKGFNPKTYIKKANCYVMYYQIMHDTRKIWNDSPYVFKEVWQCCPDTWLDDYDNVKEHPKWEQYKYLAEIYTQ